MSIPFTESRKLPSPVRVRLKHGSKDKPLSEAQTKSPFTLSVPGTVSVTPHPKHVNEKVPLPGKIAGIKNQMVEAQRPGGFFTTGDVKLFHVGYQFDDIALGIPKPKQSSNPRLHFLVRAQLDPDIVCVEYFRGSIEFFVIDNFERDVVKPTIIPHQFEYVMMIAGCPEPEVLRRPLHDLETTCIDVKIGLTGQITDAERYV
jgi:hypothetical protein